MPISEQEWANLTSLIEKKVADRGISFFTSTVVKRDPDRRLIWVRELGDIPIPVVDFNSVVRTFDTQGGGGAGGGTSITGHWRWTTSTSAAASQQIGINAATWAAATVVNISKTTDAGGDATNILNLIEPGYRMYLQDQADASKWGRYQVTQAATDHGTYFSYPVTFLEGAGTPPANNASTGMVATAPPVPGPTGPPGPQGPQGVAGEKWFTGSGVPADATGAVGDWYLDSASGNYYEKMP